VAHVVAELLAFASYITFLCHDYYLAFRL